MTINVPAGRYTVCVIRDDGPGKQAVVFAGPNGTRMVYEAVPAGLLAEPAELFNRVSKMFGEDPGTLLLSRVPLNLEHPHDELVHVAAMIAAAHTGGWHVSGAMQTAVSTLPADGGKPLVDPSIGDAPNPLTGWYTFRHDAGHILHVGILPLIDQAKTPVIDIKHDSPARMAGQLVAYHQHVGSPYRATPGVAGCAAVRDKWARAARTPMARAKARNGEHVEPLWQVPMPEGVPLAHGDIVWQRKPIDGETELPRHVFDMYTMYLAAMQVAPLPYGDITHMTIDPGAAKTEHQFTGKHAGVWRIECDTIDPIFCTGEILPPLVHMRMMNDDGSLWLTTPIFAELSRRKAFGRKGYRILEYYISTETRQWLRPIAEQWRNALHRTQPPIPHAPMCTEDKCAPSCLRWALGSTYKQTVGMIGRDGGSIHNPLARAMVVDTGRVQMWVKLWDFYILTGYTPVSVKTDEVQYHTKHDARWVGERLGVTERNAGRTDNYPGKFRHVRTEFAATGPIALRAGARP